LSKKTTFGALSPRVFSFGAASPGAASPGAASPGAGVIVAPLGSFSFLIFSTKDSQ